MSVALTVVMLLVLCLAGLNTFTFACAEDATIYFERNEDGSFCSATDISYSSFYKSQRLVPVKMINSDIALIINTNHYLMRYSEDNFALAEKQSFSSANLDEISSSSLQNDTKKMIIAFLSEFNQNVVTFSMGSPYIDFAGKTYMDEIVVVEAYSEKNVSTHRFDQIMENTALVFIDGAVSTSAIGAISITLKNIFSSGDLPPQTNIRYDVYLSEDKYVKVLHSRRQCWCIHK